MPSPSTRRRTGRVANRDRAGRIEVCTADGRPPGGRWPELVDLERPWELTKVAGSVGLLVLSTSVLGMPLVGLGCAVGAVTLGVGQIVGDRRHPRIGAALDPRAKATGEAVIRSRGDWCVVRVDGRGSAPWRATVVRFRAQPVSGAHRDGPYEVTGRAIWHRDLSTGANTIGLEIGQDLPATGADARSETWYELRVHTVDGRRLAARRVVVVRS